MPRWPDAGRAAALALALGCAGRGSAGAGGADTGGSVDTAPPPHGLEGRVDCATAPAVTWEGWAQGFFLTHCQGCHASTTPDRRGAPDGVAFDDAASTLAQRERVWVRTLDVQDMPPAGGLTADDRALLGAYLACSPAPAAASGAAPPSRAATIPANHAWPAALR